MSAGYRSIPAKDDKRTKTASRPDPLYYLLVCLVAAVLAVLLRATPPKGWAACCFAGAPILLAVRCPSRRVWLANGVLAVLIAEYYRLAHGTGAGPWTIGLAFGAGSAAMLIALARVAATTGDRSECLRTAAVVSVFPIKLYLAVILLPWAALLSPGTYDAILTAVDRSLGMDVSFAVGRLISASDWVRLVIASAYDALPIAMMVAAAIRWKRYGASDAASIPLGAAIAAALGWTLYFLVPAAGPIYLWGARFPHQAPMPEELNLVLSSVDPIVYRNAMPSLHFTGALMVAWGTWSLGRAQRFFGFVFLVLTVLATLGLGQHYAVDLIVAVPFAAAIEAAVRRPTGWWRVTFTGASMTLVWMVLLRATPELFMVPGVTWALVGLTLAAMPTAMWWHSLQLFRVAVREPSAASF